MAEDVAEVLGEYPVSSLSMDKDLHRQQADGVTYRGYVAAQETMDEKKAKADEAELRRIDRDEAKRKELILVERLAPLIAERIALQYTDAQMISELAELGVKISRENFRRLKKFGRLHLMGVLDKSPEEFKAEALGMYDSVLRNPAADLKDKIQAQQRKDRLLGLESMTTNKLRVSDIQKILENIDESQEDAEE